MWVRVPSPAPISNGLVDNRKPAERLASKAMILEGATPSEATNFTSMSLLKLKAISLI
jgi:hypothetical protein